MTKFPVPAKLAVGTGGSVVVDRCQVCDEPNLQPGLFLGYLPPVNQMRTIGERPHEQPAYPAQWLYCPKCQLVQLGLIVDPAVLFPPEYPYTSGTTKILRENFAELAQECVTIIPLDAKDLIVDVGSNDGTLLSNFAKGHKVHGIEPSDMGKLAASRGIPTTIAFFGPAPAAAVRKAHGQAAVVTATNVFAHIENIHPIVESVLELLRDDGVFISESHYLISLLETLQYDTIYHEHLRYYSLRSLSYLLGMHGLEVIHAKRIPTHGGSIRVYAARKGKHAVRPTVAKIMAEEDGAGAMPDRLKAFDKRVTLSKLALQSIMLDLKRTGMRVYGVGAPSRASTLITHVGLDEGMLDCVVEVKGSYKVGKYMPGTLIPVVDEARLFAEQPEVALLLSWHIADELMPKLTERGFKGRYLIPLPEPRLVASR